MPNQFKQHSIMMYIFSESVTQIRITVTCGACYEPGTLSAAIGGVVGEWRCLHKFSKYLENYKRPNS